MASSNHVADSIAGKAFSFLAVFHEWICLSCSCNRSNFSFPFQRVFEEILNADSGAPCSPKHSRKKSFIESVKRSISSHSTSKQLTEAAAVTCVRLCKASTYINKNSTNVAFTLVQNIINDLKVREILCPFSINLLAAVCQNVVPFLVCWCCSVWVWVGIMGWSVWVGVIIRRALFCLE